MATVLGLIGSALSALIALPQAVRAFRVGIEGVSAMTFQLFALDMFLWSSYDLRRHYWVAAPGLLIPIACATAILIAIYRRNRNWREVAPVYVVGALVSILLTIFVPKNPVGWGAVVFSTILALPQLRDVFVKGNIDGVSIPTWLDYAASGIVWFGFGIVKHDARLIVANSFTFVQSSAIAIETLRRRRVH